MLRLCSVNYKTVNFNLPILPVNKYISSSCVIQQNRVCKNGIEIFKNKNSSLHEFFISLYQYLQIPYPKFYKMDNMSKLGWLASAILLRDGYIQGKYSAEQTGIVISNADSSLDTDLKYFETMNDLPSPALFVYTLPNIMIGEISISNNFKGENAFFIFDQFDAEFTEKYVSDLLDNKSMNACICGWVNVLREEYKAALFLVEKGEGGVFPQFTKEYMEVICNGPVL